MTWTFCLLDFRSFPDYGVFMDRIGEGANLEEHWFNEPWTIEG